MSRFTIIYAPPYWSVYELNKQFQPLLVAETPDGAIDFAMRLARAGDQARIIDGNRIDIVDFPNDGGQRKEQ